MSYLSFDSKIVPLLQGLKPYLNSRSQLVTDGILGLIQVVNSQPGQEAVQTISKFYPASGNEDRVITVNTAAGPVTFSLNLVFVLFLILILLLLSGNLLAFSSGMNGGEAADFEQLAEGRNTQV